MLGGRPDVMELIKAAYEEWNAEVVFITSNLQGNQEMTEGCMEAGIPAFVRIFTLRFLYTTEHGLRVLYGIFDLERSMTDLTHKTTTFFITTTNIHFSDVLWLCIGCISPTASPTYPPFPFRALSIRVEVVNIC